MAESLTLEDAARIMRDAVKDRSYRATPLGLAVARYYRWKRNEWGATESTLRDYEAILARLSLYFADLELRDLEPPVGTERLREFWDHHWSEQSPRTRAKVLSVLRNFFGWAITEGLLIGNPALPISRPKQRQVQRETFTPDVVQRVIASQTNLRDRVALRLLFELALRKGELRRVQFKHFDLSRRRLTVFGKGGKVRVVPIVGEHLRLDLERHILDRNPAPDDYLIYPEKHGPGNWIKTPEGMKVPVVLLAEYPGRILSESATHRWWYGCLERAGIVGEGVTQGQRMHKSRHTAITELVRHPGANMKHAQLLAGHASEATTADTYSHLDDVDLERVMRELAVEREREA